MKVAVVYNRASQRVINVLGTPNRERYGKKSIDRIVRCLRAGGHQVSAFEGDRDLIDKLERFMPSAVAGERPGMVFNLAYGIQGQARYTHVPGILEMVGLPYVGSGPMAHSLALDKVVAKMVFVQHGLPTPEFAVLESPDVPPPELPFPLIVKPRNEAVSFGIKVVHDHDALREAAGTIFEQFHQAVLVERYIDGREVNVGILGNDPPEALPPAELDFGDGPRIYTLDDKRHVSGREVRVVCPAPLTESETERAQRLAVRAFTALGCFDCARIDMRLDAEGRFHILEINSLPSLGEHGSYVQGAAAVGLDFCGLVNRLVDVASTRYFGRAQVDPDPSRSGPEHDVFTYITGRRDHLERRIQEWTRRSSRTSDPVGLRAAVGTVEKTMTDLGLRRVEALCDESVARTWESPAGLDGGTLLIVHLDVPLPFDAAVPPFRRDPEWLHGEGVGSSRAPLVVVEYALRALRRVRALRRASLGVLVYTDEGRDAADSAATIAAAARRAARVLVVRPGSRQGRVVTQRRGLRHYALTVRGPTRRLGQATRKPDLVRWLLGRLEACAALSDRKERVAVGVGDLRTSAYRALLPHEVRVDLMVGFPHEEAADALEQRIRETLGGDRDAPRWEMELASNRPAMPDRRANRRLAQQIARVAEELQAPFAEESSLLPSVAGLVPEGTPVVCGMGPAAVETYTSHEAVQRISVVQRTLLLARSLLALERAPEGVG